MVANIEIESATNCCMGLHHHVAPFDLWIIGPTRLDLDVKKNSLQTLNLEFSTIGILLFENKINIKCLSNSLEHFFGRFMFNEKFFVFLLK
jgi:hypothetical protein